MQLLCFVSLPPPISTYLSHLDSLRPPQSHNPHLHLLSGARVRLPFPSLPFSYSLRSTPFADLQISLGWQDQALHSEPFSISQSFTPHAHAHARGPRARKGKPAAQSIPRPRGGRRDIEAHQLRRMHGAWHDGTTRDVSSFSIQHSVSGIRYPVFDAQRTADDVHP